MRGNVRNDGARSPDRASRPSARPSLAVRHFRTGNSVFSTPVIGADETLYLGSADCWFYAYDPIAGRERWRFRTGEAIDCAACLGPDGTVYVASCDASIYALDPEGRQKWRLDVLKDRRFSFSTIYWWEANVVMGPNGLLYAGSDDFYLYCIDPATGAERWALPTGLNIWTAPAFGPDGTLYVISFDMFCYAVDADTGRVKWKTNTGNLCASSPAVGPDGTIWFGSFDGNVYGLDPADGSPRWSYATGGPVYATPAIAADGTLYIGSSDGLMHAVSTSQRRALWTFFTGDAIRSSASLGVDPEGRAPYLVYFGGGNGLVYALDPEGRRRWSYDTTSGDDYPNINASIALGHHGLATASASGDLVYVPYDHYLAPDARGVVREPGDGYPESGDLLYPVSTGGRPHARPVAADGGTALEIQPGGTVSFQLVARRARATPARTITSVEVETSPPLRHRAWVQPDGKQLNLAFEGAAAGGEHRVTVHATHDGADRPMTAAWTFTVRFLPAAVAPPAAALLDAPFRVHQMAVYSPAIVPNFDQIGIASLHIDVRVVRAEGDRVVAWGVKKFGIKETGDTAGVPVGRHLLYAFAGTYADGHLALEARPCAFGLTAVAAPLDVLRLTGSLDARGVPALGASLSAAYTLKGAAGLLPAAPAEAISLSAYPWVAARRAQTALAALEIARKYVRTWFAGGVRAVPDALRAASRLAPLVRGILGGRVHGPWGLVDAEGRFSGVGTFRASPLPGSPLALPAGLRCAGVTFDAHRRRVTATFAAEGDAPAPTVPIVAGILLVDMDTCAPVAFDYDLASAMICDARGLPSAATLDVPLHVPLRGRRLEAVVLLDLAVAATLPQSAS